MALQHAPGVLSYSGFCGVSAVHAAVALLAESADGASRHFGHALDLEYLQRIGVADRIDAWRQLAQAARNQAMAS